MANLDQYLPCDDYAGKPTSESYPGFTAWYNDSDQQWYFGVVTTSGRVVLRSEGYASESGRNNGIESVNRNRDIEERYDVIEDDGEWFVILRAGNRQEIARSCAYGSEADARSGVAACRSDYAEKAARSGVSADELDNYLPCEAYENAPASDSYPGFRAWYNEADAHYYFAVVTPGGRVALRSEGYTSEAARNNGIESVIRNRDIEERYVVIEDGGEWFVILKAGNHQEIARSCSYPDQAAASDGRLMGMSSFNDVVEEKAARSAAIIEDYLSCDSYAGKEPVGYDGFTGFQDPETGLYYFAMVGNDGNVILKSEGYTAISGRNNGIESVIRNRDISERWVQSQDEGGYYMSLRAGNRQEIARTCHHDSEGALLGWWMPFSTSWSFGRQAELVEVESEPATLESIQVESVVSETPVRVEIEEIAPIIVVPEPEIVIPPIEVEEPEIEIPVVAAAIAAAAVIPEIEIPKAEIVVKKEAVIVPPVIVEPEKEYQPKWKKKEEKVEKTVVYTKPVEEPVYVPPVTQLTEREPEGGGGWWKWLLPLLLLGLLFFLWKGCDGCKKAEVKAPEVSVTAPTPPPVVTPPPPPPAPKCNCTGNADDLFNIGSGTPKSLTRLGTNPEFGNSHGLSGEQFYNKIAARAKASRTDAAFLDRVFKGMGYAGWADATPEMFSEVEVPAGTVGNMGYSKAHKTVFARLDAQGKDLLAFRIKSKNACDFHFMKTCGNHFFFCPN